MSSLKLLEGSTITTYCKAIMGESQDNNSITGDPKGSSFARIIELHWVSWYKHHPKPNSNPYILAQFDNEFYHESEAGKAAGAVAGFVVVTVASAAFAEEDSSLAFPAHTPSPFTSFSFNRFPALNLYGGLCFNGEGFFMVLIYSRNSGMTSFQISI